MVKWEAAWKKEYPNAPAGRPNNFDLLAYGDTYVLAEAMKRAGRDLNADGLVKALEGMQNYRVGPVATPRTFSTKHHIGNLTLVPMIVKDGQWDPVPWSSTPRERHPQALQLGAPGARAVRCPREEIHPMTTTLAVQLAIAGISVGSIYALVALAIVIPFKASGVLNFGQGEVVTFGAYAALVLTQLALPYPVVLASVLVLGARRRHADRAHPDPADREGAGVHARHRHVRDRPADQGRAVAEVRRQPEHDRRAVRQRADRRRRPALQPDLAVDLRVHGAGHAAA